ncbi:MAG: ribonuclease HI [Clostridia bacterium]|nr:ribonuclease HI [Clostridia bacterium]
MYTDGACSGNPGPGGYGCILEFRGIEREIHGGEHETTNNRMELTAVIKGLEAFREKCRIIITTDSKYVCDAITKGWAKSWKANNWKKSDGKKALNIDLWERLLELLAEHEVEFVWVKGHNGHAYNERCDRMAVEETEKHK